MTTKEKEVYMNEIKERFKDQSLQELRESKFLNMMDDHWKDENYLFDDVMDELIKKKEALENEI